MLTLDTSIDRIMTIKYQLRVSHSTSLLVKPYKVVEVILQPAILQRRIIALKAVSCFAFYFVKTFKGGQ